MSFKLRISHNKKKKYDAVFDDGHIVSFGAIRPDGTPYEQYKDSTPLKKFSKYDHYDLKRRELYYKRHKINYPKFSADWFSKTFLW